MSALFASNLGNSFWFFAQAFAKAVSTERRLDLRIALKAWWE